MKIAILGNGNVGKALYEGLQNLDYVVQVFARSPDSYREKSIDELFSYDPHLCYFAVNDHAIRNVAEYVSGLDHNTILVHMSGATPLNEIDNKIHKRKAVMYPLQTIRKGQPTDWKNLPIFIQASDIEVRSIIFKIANQLSSIVCDADDETRLTVHLAAVMTNNFINHLTKEAYSLLNEKGIDESVLFPILKTTFEKLTSNPPELTQTGPAVRGDLTTIRRHMSIIQDPSLSKVYEVLSDNIMKKYAKKI